MASWQEELWQHTLNCLKPSPERSRTHCFGYVCHSEDMEIETELHRNGSLHKLKSKEPQQEATCAHILVDNSLFYHFIAH